MKNYLPVLLLTCLLLTGCGALLERSYSVVEPYADRYWDSAAEDTLRAENHQDVVNSGRYRRRRPWGPTCSPASPLTTPTAPGIPP